MAGYIFIAPRVYYLKTNGAVVKKTMDGEGWFTKDISPEEDWELYPELKEYNKEALDYIQLKYKEFDTEFKECTSYHVDVASKKIVFEYGEKPNPPEVPVKPSLHERVDNLELGAEATQEALDMLLLSSMGEPVQAVQDRAVSTLAIDYYSKKGGDNMAAYIAMRIIKKGEKSVDAGRDYYVTWMTHPAYARYKADVDLILQAEERDELIVESL